MLVEVVGPGQGSSGQAEGSQHEGVGVAILGGGSYTGGGSVGEARKVPIYEYKCANCDTTFEELVLSRGAAEKVRCPNCGQRRLVRRPSVFAAHSGGSRPRSSKACGECDLAGGACPWSGRDR